MSFKMLEPVFTAADERWDQIASRANGAGDRYALFVGDALDVLCRLPAETIHTCLTSPPYWGARDYEHPEQLGLEDEIEDYVDRLVTVFREIRRLLVPQGTAWGQVLRVL